MREPFEGGEVGSNVPAFTAAEGTDEGKARLFGLIDVATDGILLLGEVRVDDELYPAGERHSGETGCAHCLHSRLLQVAPGSQQVELSLHSPA